MEDAQFSDAFCRFVQTHIPTVDAAEALIALFRSPEARSEAVDEYGAAFRAAGLFDNAELKAHVATLAQAYDERPVTLVRLIYALRDSKIRSFADAFKLRKP